MPFILERNHYIYKSDSLFNNLQNLKLEPLYVPGPQDLRRLAGKLGTAGHSWSQPDVKLGRPVPPRPRHSPRPWGTCYRPKQCHPSPGEVSNAENLRKPLGGDLHSPRKCLCSSLCPAISIVVSLAQSSLGSMESVTKPPIWEWESGEDVWERVRWTHRIAFMVTLSYLLDVEIPRLYGSGSKPCTPGEHKNSW